MLDDCTRARHARSAAVLAALAFLIAAPAGVSAQTETGVIAGTITDGTAGALPGVTVSALNQATAQTRTTVTNDAGLYQLVGLQPSAYTITAEIQGFKTVRFENVRVAIGAAVDLDLSLEVADVNETITVTSEAPMIEPSKTGISQLITAEQLESLPSKSHQYLDFALLLPATVENVSTTQQGGGLNIGGARSKEAALLVDGFYNMDESFGLPRQRYSQDAIQEFQVVSFAASAEHGRSIGGIVNAITKSGGNDLAGSAYGYFRGTSLNAQDFGERSLDLPKSEFDRQQWGGTLGGPVVRERTFFFGAYERIDEDYGFANSIRAADADAIGLPADDIGSLPRFYLLNFGMAKVDHGLGPNDRLQGHFAFSRWTEFDITTATALGTRSQQQRLAATDWSYGAKWTHVSPQGRLVHDVKFSYFPRYYAVGGVAVGGPPLTTEGRINAGHQTSSSPPRVTIASVANFGSAATDSQITTYPIQAIYSTSMLRGNHSFKFGADYHFARVNLNFHSRLRGTYTFGSLANFLAGRYTNYSQAFGDPEFTRDHHYVSGYVQDSWQPSTRLTVNYGVRYDFELHPKHFATGQRLGEDYNNLFPRFGLAYDLTDKGTTLLKLSSGIYVDRLYQRLSVWYPDLKEHASVVSATWLPGEPGAPVYPAVFATRPTTLPGSIVNAWVFPDELNTPASGQVVATLEHALTPSFVVTGSAVYTRSWNKEYQWDANLAWDEAQQRWVRPDPNYRQLQQYQFDGRAEYVGGIFEVIGRNPRFGYNANLTVARSYDSGNTGDNFPNDQRLGIDDDWGPSADTPAVRGVVSGWLNVVPAVQVSGAYRARTGMPVTPTAVGLDLNGDLRVGDRTPTFLRNRIRLPGAQSLDLRVAWAPPIGSGQRLHLYLEAFNVLDERSVRTANADYGPDPATPKPRWLEPLTFFPPREVQIGARFTF